MAKCTAPVKGHRTVAAAANCPECGPLMRSALPPVQHPPHRRPPLHKKKRRVEKHRETTAEQLVNIGLTASTADSLTVSLLDTAESLQRRARWRLKPRHWLCQLLADTADAVDPAVLGSLVGANFKEALVARGMPPWAAAVAGKGISEAASAVLASLMPHQQLILGLRVLALLCCPDADRCPASERLVPPVLRAAASPAPPPQ
jgi:hypothetical protein